MPDGSTLRLPALSALLKNLQHDDDEVRIWSLAALAGLGPAAHKAVPCVLPLLMDKQARVRDAAKKALVALDPELANRAASR